MITLRLFNFSFSMLNTLVLSFFVILTCFAQQPPNFEVLYLPAELAKCSDVKINDNGQLIGLWHPIIGSRTPCDHFPINHPLSQRKQRSEGFFFECVNGTSLIEQRNFYCNLFWEKPPSKEDYILAESSSGCLFLLRGGNYFIYKSGALEEVNLKQSFYRDRMKGKGNHEYLQCTFEGIDNSFINNKGEIAGTLLVLWSGTGTFYGKREFISLPFFWDGELYLMNLNDPPLYQRSKILQHCLIKVKGLNDQGLILLEMGTDSLITLRKSDFSKIEIEWYGSPIFTNKTSGARLSDKLINENGDYFSSHPISINSQFVLFEHGIHDGINYYSIESLIKESERNLKKTLQNKDWTAIQINNKNQILIRLKKIPGPEKPTGELILLSPTHIPRPN